MYVIKPYIITDAALVGSSIPENDYPAWNPATNYAAGALVIHVPTHSVYRRVVAGVSAMSPDLDATNWSRVGPTNRWAMFDRATGTVSTAAGALSVQIAPGVGGGLALLDVAGAEVSVSMTDPATGSTVYSRTVSLSDPTVSDWSEYFFGEIGNRTTVVLNDLPFFASGVIAVTITGPGTVGIGTLAAGRVIDLGGTKYGAQVGIIDYSVKSTNAFGVTTVTERNFAKKLTAQTVLEKRKVDATAARLAALRATPGVWVGADEYESTVVYGFFRDFGVDISYPVLSVCSLTIEGLS